MFRDLVGAVSEGLFPMACPGCGRRADPVCPSCAALLAAPQPAPPPHGVDGWAAAFAYEGVARELVARVKYRSAHAAVHWLAARMVDAVVRASIVAGVEAVTWAPTTAARRRTRGFDHAELLARPLSRAFGLPVRSLLHRMPGPPQTGLHASERRRGPIFAPRRGTPPTVLLVDDVATTGATLSAAAGALRAGGASLVVAVTAARTPRPAFRTGAGSHGIRPVDTDGCRS
jgi:predicted amidophosphoribosyltransferase